MGWWKAFSQRPPSPPAELPTTSANANEPAFAKDADDTHVISPDDVNQRNVGDCYLMSSLRALAQTNPDLLQRRISDDGQGGFNVRLYSERDKCWYRYHVGRNELGANWSGTLDRKDKSGNPIQVKDPRLSEPGPGQESELWVRIFEVAYAKHLDVHDGSSANGMQLLDRGGWPHDAMTALTGQPAEQFTLQHRVFLPLELRWKWRHADPEATGQQLADALAQNRPVAMSTPGSDKEVIGPGLRANHAYQVESVRREEGSGRWIVKLANPWGHSNPRSPGLVTLGEVYLDDALNQGLLDHMDMGAPQPRPSMDRPIHIAELYSRYPLPEYAVAA